MRNKAFKIRNLAINSEESAEKLQTIPEMSATYHSPSSKNQFEELVNMFKTFMSKANGHSLKDNESNIEPRDR